MEFTAGLQQGFFKQLVLVTLPPGLKPKLPFGYTFPNRAFFTVTSGTDIPFSAPPFLAGVGNGAQAGRLHKGWHWPPFVLLGSALSGLSSQDSSQSGTETRNEPRIIWRQQVAILWMLTVLVKLGMPQRLWQAIIPGDFHIFLHIRIHWGTLKKSQSPAHTPSGSAGVAPRRDTQPYLFTSGPVIPLTATLENQGSSPIFSDLSWKASPGNLAKT